MPESPESRGPEQWVSARRAARKAYVEACIAALLAEAASSGSATTPLWRAAFRLQSRARDGGVFLGFDQALYALRRRDHARVFAR